MRSMTKFAVAVSLAVSAVSVASSANALVFASYTQLTDQRLVWNRDDVGGNFKNGKLFTSNNPFNQNTATFSPIAAKFSFSTGYAGGLLTGMQNLNVAFSMQGSEVNTPAVNLGPLINPNRAIQQPNINGSYNFVYTGPTFTTVNNILVSTGTTLLTGTFTNASFVGNRFSLNGNFNAAQPSTMVFSSPFINFATSSQRTTAMDLFFRRPYASGANAAPRAVQDWQANSQGTFSAVGIPEPATWGLMILGFGGAGVMLRSNRRRMAVVAA